MMILDWVIVSAVIALVWVTGIEIAHLIKENKK